MFRLRETCAFKLRERASVFLAELHPAGDAAARGTVLTGIRRRDFDATHHCSAWREGLPVGAWGSDDDGEPAGTAGPPMLRVLEGADLTDILAVCVRWFGGTKLGTGGLVRAYTEAVQGALEEARNLGLLEPVRVLRQGTLTIEAAQAHLPFAVLGAFPEAEVVNQAFEPGEATLRFRVPPEVSERLERAWQERSRGGRIHWD